MLAVEFVALRKNLGLSQAGAAERLCIPLGRIQYWESRWSVHIDCRLVDELRRLDAALENAVLYSVEEIALPAQERPPSAVALLRYRSDRDFAHYKPVENIAFGSYKVHRALIERTRQAVGRLAIDAQVVDMDPDRYEPWRAKHDWPDCEEVRRRWAGVRAFGYHKL